MKILAKDRELMILAMLILMVYSCRDPKPPKAPKVVDRTEEVQKNEPGALNSSKRKNGTKSWIGFYERSEIDDTRFVK